MKNITIIDAFTQKKIEISFSEYYDLIIGLDCASQFYEEVGRHQRVQDFKKMSANLKTISD